MRIPGSSAGPAGWEPGLGADPPGGECGLARLLLAGDGVEGAYTPLGFELVGGGADLLADRIAHLHEIHHVALNDSTEWGSALHITARVPGSQGTFSVLLERCREIHEAFATFAGVALANEVGGDAAAVLARYPLYVPLLAAFERLVRQVHGPNRRYLMATQYARVCMQAADMDSVDNSDPELHLRLGHWKIDLARQGIRAGVLSAVAAAVLVHQGLAEFGVAFATAVLPAVFDIERIELSPGDQRLVTEIRLKYAYREGFATEDELYESLPSATQDVINRYDFADFIGRLRAAGLTDETGGRRLRLRAPDDPRPGIGLR
jgi:hypothetical protein